MKINPRLLGRPQQTVDEVFSGGNLTNMWFPCYNHLLTSPVYCVYIYNISTAWWHNAGPMLTSCLHAEPLHNDNTDTQTTWSHNNKAFINMLLLVKPEGLCSSIGGTFTFRCQRTPARMKKGILWKLPGSGGRAEMTPRRAVISYSITAWLCVHWWGGGHSNAGSLSLSTSLQLFVLKCCALIKMPF